MIGNEIRCLKKVGTFQLNEASSKCQSLDASQIVPRNRQETDDLVSALLSLNLDSDNGNTWVSIGIQNTTKEGGWRDFTGQLLSYFNWLPNEPDNLGGDQSYAGFRIDGLNGIVGWADYSGVIKLNVVCTKRGQSKGKRSRS